MIGPTFGDELAAAGCNNGVVWDCATGEIQYSDYVTDEQRAQVAAVLAAHDPNKVPTVPPMPVSNLKADLAALLKDPQSVAALKAALQV